MDFEVRTKIEPLPTTVIGYDSPNLTLATVTTNQLGAGTGSFVAGKVSEYGLVDDLGWSGSNYTEVLYPLTLKKADLTGGDTLRFRVLRNGATTYLTYSQTPTVTIGTGVPVVGTGRPKVWTGAAWVNKPGKYWNGTTWTEKPVKVWTGSTWKLAT